MSLHKQRTAGRVVEGARLERGCRVTYLGFESLAVHHLFKNLQRTLNDFQRNTDDKENYSIFSDCFNRYSVYTY